MHRKYSSHSVSVDTYDAAAPADFWPGIQLYWPPFKYSSATGTYEDMEAATRRIRKYAHQTTAHTLIFDLEDGCRKKEMGRALLRHELPTFENRHAVAIALRVNPFGTEEYRKDMQLVRDMADHVDVVMLAKAGESHGTAEVRDLSAELAGLNHAITVQPIIEHPGALKMAAELIQYPTVRHVVFGAHDFSKAMGIHITPENWSEELQHYLNQLLLEARVAGKGVIGGVDTLIGSSRLPEDVVEPQQVRDWLARHDQPELRIVYKHACKEASMGLTGKQVIHPSHIQVCKVAFVPSPAEITRKITILETAINAGALLGGAIRFEDEMLDPPMFAKALQTLLRARALRSLPPAETAFAMNVLQRMSEGADSCASACRQ